MSIDKRSGVKELIEESDIVVSIPLDNPDSSLEEAEKLAIANECPLYNIETRRVLSPKPFSGRKRDERARKRALGYVLRQIWIKPEHWPRVRKYLEKFA